MNIYLDLDRTLFDTDLFDKLRWQFLENEFGVSPEQGESRQRDFFIYDGDMYHYDFTEHMSSAGLDPDQVYEAIRHSELADGRLEYPGTDRLIKKLGNRTRILTYGAED